MAELWGIFSDKLQESGYTLKDLDYCSDDLFLTITEELGVFSPLQISSLLSHWHRTKRAGTADHSAPPDRATSASAASLQQVGQRHPGRATPVGDVKPAPAYPAASVKQAAQRLLQRVSLGGAEGAPLAAQDVIAVEAPLSNWLAFRECLSRQQRRSEPAKDPITLLWKLCSPATLTRIERACAASRGLILTNEDDTDALCESGLVLFDGSVASTLGSNAAAPELLRRRVCEEGWALVAFDAAAGRSRTVSVEEIGNLRHFTMSQCSEMLAEAGYDSLSVASVGAVVVCDATQVVPRNVVYAAEAATNRTGGEPRQEPARAPTRRGSTHAGGGDSRRLEFSTTVDDIEEPLASAANTNAASSAAAAARAHEPLTLAPAPAIPKRHAAIAVATPNATSLSAATALPTDPPPVTRCDVHPLKEVEFWCPTEKRLLCSHCLYYDGYSRETCLPIEVAARREVPRLERWVGNATTFTKEVQGVMQLFADAKADIARQEGKVGKDIARQFAHLRERLNALEADMQHEVQDQSRTKRQDVDAALHDVGDTVHQVDALLGEVETPLKLYRASGSAAGLVACVQLLRGVQRAFTDWPAVDIAPYQVVAPLDGILGEAEAALGRVARVSVVAGKVELPEAIDVNFLRTDAE